MLLTDIINSYMYVSFDVFDTLIKRSVAKPGDLFLLMENRIAHIWPEIPGGFANKRKEAEIKANEELGRPVGIGEIYQRLRSEYGNRTDELMHLEIQMEMDGCRPNPECLYLYEQCRSKGKTVILISDMYLPASVIGKMLEKCGVSEYQKLYISCEWGARKGDGSLFRAVLADMKVRPQELVHIGDSTRGDFLAPFSMGIRTVRVKNDQKEICKTPKTIKEEDKLTYRTLRSCVRNCSYNMTDCERMGCEIFGPQLYGFTQWLVGKLRQDGIRDVYFLARDGYMLKRAFDELKTPDIRTNYLYCSRRAFQVPMLADNASIEAIKEMLAFRRNLTLRRLLLQLGLDPNVYCSRANEYGLDMDRVYGFDELMEVVKEFYSQIKDDVVENAKSEYNAIMEYLGTLNISDRIAVVDIGFHGTIQYCLEQLLERTDAGKRIKGYYFCGSKEYFEKFHINADGYIYRETPYSLLFEAQFLAQDGSLKRFSIENGRSIPQFEMPEYENNDKKLVDELFIIQEYQLGAIKFIQYMGNTFGLADFTVSPDTALHKLNRLLNCPTLSEARFWGDFRFINYTRGYLAHPKSLSTYLAHPGRLKQDYFSCGWQIGFMRRLFLLPVPYERIFHILKQVYYKKQ